MSYFRHHFASNSDIKELVSRVEGRQKPDNISEIYNFGTEFHAGILERHKMRPDAIDQGKKELIDAMSATFWRDDMCRTIAMMPDFRREHEFYRINRYGLEGVRCKCDGETAKLQTILELKGLSITTEKAFKESIMHLDYDQGGAWYIDTATGHVVYKRKLIVGISKRDPDLMFKMLIDRDHQMYKTGSLKIRKGVALWKQMGYK